MDFTRKLPVCSFKSFAIEEKPERTKNAAKLWRNSPGNSPASLLPGCYRTFIQ